MYAEPLLENSLLAASAAGRSLSRAEGSRRCVGSLASVPDDDIDFGESLTKKCGDGITVRPLIRASHALAVAAV
jgi:hypothetical protein